MCYKAICYEFLVKPFKVSGIFIRHLCEPESFCSFRVTSRILKHAKSVPSVVLLLPVHVDERCFNVSKEVTQRLRNNCAFMPEALLMLCIVVGSVMMGKSVLMEVESKDS